MKDRYVELPEGDYHIHSKYSDDSKLEPRTILSIAKARKLCTIAITDHETIKGGVETQKVNDTSINVIIGAEIYTDKGEVTGLFLKKEIKNRKLMEVVKEIKGQGGKVVVPHPFDSLRKGALGNGIEEIIEYIDYIEGFNGRCLFNSFNQRARTFAAKHNIPIIKGSDAHFAFEIGNVETSMSSFFRCLLAHTITKSIKVLKKSLKT
jgi:predicted metal-dependent phosphoesterase TrpH